MAEMTAEMDQIQVPDGGVASVGKECRSRWSPDH